MITTLLILAALASVSILGVIGINYGFSVGVSGTNGTRVNGSFTETGVVSIDIATNLSAGSSNVPVAAAWHVASTQAIFLLSSSNLTLKTNSASSPGNTINLVAGVPLMWDASAGYYPCPFTVDVTGFFCTCTAAALLQASILTT
jgi:hypothetical protein